MVTDPATGNTQLLSLDTGPEGAWHKNCGGSGDVGGWWLLDTFPPTQDVPTVTFDTSGAGCATIHTQLSTLDQQIVIALCPTAGAQVPNIQWSAHADNCSTWSEYRDGCTAYEQAPWFEIRHQCLSVVPGDLNDCGDMQRTYGKITDLGNTCTDWINQGCVLTSNRCASNNSPCTDEALTYACTADGCQQWGQALLCSACIPNPPGPPKCKDTTTPINNEFGLATAMMEGMVTLGHDLRNENDVRAFPGFLQVCKSNLLVNCCDTAAAQKMAQNVNTAINAVQMTMQALQIANLAIDFAGYMSSAMTAPIVSQMTFSEAVGFAAQSTMSDFLAGMFAFSWAGVVMIAVMVIVMVIQILMQCDEASTETAAKINLKLCIPVGNYCATKILFGCWSTAHAHCCYSNKLSRIIEEQAHSASQLNLPWGDPKDPQTCAGLTIPQLQAIDWDRMDWSEYIDDLQHRITAPTADSVTAQAPGIIGQTDYPGQAAATINKYGSLGDRVTASITVPGKDTVPDRSHPATVVLYVAVNGIGTINVSPGDQHCQGGTCKLTVPANTPLTLTATPAALTTFSGWSGDCTGGGICTLTLRDSASVAAQFATSGYSVTTAADGNGTGTITSSPAGITCPSTCATAFPPNTRVTLTASAGVNSTFTGWGGVCANQGTVCTFTVTRSVTIRAAFLQLPQIVTFGPQTPGTVKVGVPTTWTVGVSGGIPPVEVQFIRDDNGMAVTAQDFAPGTTYTWTPTAADLAGNPHRIQAAVRNAGSTSPGDDYAITDYFTVVP